MALTDATMLLNASSGSGIFDVLSPFYQRKIAEQWNRTARLLSIIPVTYGRSSGIDFVAEFGTNTATIIAENADLSKATDGYSDSEVHGSLPWVKVANQALISFRALATAKSAGENTSPEMLDLLGRQLVIRTHAMAKKINDQLFVGVGGSTDVAGLYASSSVGALASTGTYANIAKATYTAFKPGGTAGFTQPTAGTSITVDLIEQARAAVLIASGMHPDLIVASPNTYRVLKNLYNGSNVRQYIPGVSSNDTLGDDFYVSGMRVVEDVSVSEADGYGKIAMLNTNHIRFELLSPVVRPQDFVMPLLHGSSTSTDEQIAIPIVCRELAVEGDYQRIGMFLDCNLVVDRPNAHAWLSNLSLTAS